MKAKTYINVTPLDNLDYEVRFANVLIGYFYREIDGFFIYEHASTRSGYYSEIVLRQIADELRHLNAEQQANLDNYFATVS